MIETTYPLPEALEAEAARIEQSADAVADSSEYPRVAAMACRGQVEALKAYAETLREVGTVPAKRSGMTGEERRERRAAILRLRAARLKVKASQHFRASHDIGSRIPFGQPILVGHHSERGHRRAIERMHSNDRAAFQASEYAEQLDSRADRVERSGAISATDSDAVEQYEEKLADLVRIRDKQKAINLAWRKFSKNNDPAPLYALGLDDSGITRLSEKIATAYSWEKQPYPGWSLTNLGARIRDIEKKLEHLKAAKAAPVTETETESGITIEDNPADNRIRIFFPGKPDEATRSKLKANGFRWTPSLGCWQAYRNWRAETTAKEFTAA